MEDIKIAVTVGTSGVDVAIEKVQKLIDLLDQAKKLLWDIGLKS